MGTETVDILWLLISAGLVFLMQGGFLCLEAGLSRSKNNINVAIKNMIDLCFSVLLFWLVGYGLMFGHSWQGWLGTTGFSLEFGQVSKNTAVFFLFQVMFCGTAVTILSGAVAERVRFKGYLLLSILVSALIYPIFGHWSWNGLESSILSGWLGVHGFIDFAGSTVVHSVGGWVALAVLLVIGPRSGRFPVDGPPRQIPGSNIPLAMLGVLLLWFGWFGFNGGSTLTFNDQVPLIIVNTLLAGISGTLAVLLFSLLQNKMIDVGFILNGSLAGLVAITANPYALSTLSVIIIGAVGGLVMVGASYGLERWQIDDVVGAIPVHLAAGIWGTLAVALFGDFDLLGTELSRWQQIQIQLVGIVACFLWAFGVTYLIIDIINRFFPLRVSVEIEQVGLNIAEHGATTELLELFTVMDKQSKTGNLRLRVPVEPFTEVGQIADRYNQVMDSLEQAVAKTEAIVNTALDGIITFSTDSLAILTLNPSVETMFGYSATQLIGQPVTILFQSHQSSLQPATANVANFTLTPHLHHGKIQEMYGKRANGSTFPMELVLTQTTLATGNFYTGMIRNVTKRREDERLLQRQNTYLEALHEVSLGLISRLEIDDLLVALIVRLVEMLDAQSGAVLLHTDESDEIEYKVGIGIFAKKIGQRIKPGQGLTGQVWATDKPIIINGYDSWPGRDPGFVYKKSEAGVAVPLKSGSKRLGVLVVAYDTDSRKNIDQTTLHLLTRFADLGAVALDNAQLYNEAKLARQTAEIANQAKSDFLANVSHEFRTPLTSVLGFAKLIEKRLKPVFDQVEAPSRKTQRSIKQITQNINIIISEGERLTALINDVLDLAKIEAGKIDWQMEALNINEVVQQAIHATSSLYTTKQIDFRQEIPTNIPLVYGDRNRLIQVMINLISNAVKFTEVGEIACRITLQKHQLVVSLKDSGLGIPESEIELIFEKFRQVGNTLTDKPEGTGLGLSICKHIIEHHQGDIWVESVLGQGSCFSFSLPYYK